MEKIADEIFNVLKGANYSLLTFDEQGQKTADPESATRFYSQEQDLMVSLRTEDAKIEIVVQAGEGYDVTNNQNLISQLKKIAHKNLGEFTVKKFDKQITPKDFAHQSISEGIGKPFGSTKTSYMQLPQAKIIIKHKQSVDEEVKGSRSRNIHSLFIENSQGERFKFPHRYMSGAKAMAMHINAGGTPYDEKGSSILEMCEEISTLNKFVRHVKSNKLVSEDNTDIIETVKSKLGSLKNNINNLSTQRGYNNFEVQENEEVSGVDVTEKFLYNTFTTEEMQDVMQKVGRIVAERETKESRHIQLLKSTYDLIQSGKDLGISYDENDPEHPDNENPRKYSGSLGPMAKLSAMLGYLAKNSSSDELFNYASQLSTDIHEMNPKHVAIVAKMVEILKNKSQVKKSSEPAEAIDDQVVVSLRKKISQ